MHKILFTVAVAGTLVSGYLWATHTNPTALICGEEGGCHTVQASVYAEHFGLPTAFYGVAYYLTLSILALVHTPSQKQPALNWLLVVVTGIGLVVSAYLTYLEAFVINAWCAWCVTSAILATFAFAIVWLQPKGVISKES